MYRIGDWVDEIDPEKKSKNPRLAFRRLGEGVSLNDIGPVWRVCWDYTRIRGTDQGRIRTGT